MAGRKPETLLDLSTETYGSRSSSWRPDAGDIEAPALTILAHSDWQRVGEMVVLPELTSRRPVELSRLSPRFSHPGTSLARPLADPHLSRTPLQIQSIGETGDLRIDRAGSPSPVKLDGEPLGATATASREALDRGVVLELGRQIVLLLHRQLTLAPALPHFGLMGASSAMVRLRLDLQAASRINTPILLRGASGTGKELAARAIHDHGERSERAFVAVNIAAIPPSLAASELFGAGKGAFTGADRAKLGFFAAADGGTLFLDEIGDTPADVQPLLLRALESGEIQPVGTSQTRRLDVRIIAATDADLHQAVAEGRFRAPLLHRLSAWEVQLPTLAERRSDIGRLLFHFLRRELRELGAGLDRSPPASLLALLARYSWPGNVRQLQNVARRIAVTLVAIDPSLDETRLIKAVEPLLLEANDGASGSEPASRRRPSDGTSPSDPVSPGAAGPLASSPTGKWRPVYREPSTVTDDELISTLRANQWNLKPTAESLGVSRASLYDLIDRCDGVRTAAQLGADEIRDALLRHRLDAEAAAADLSVSVQGLKMRLRSLGLRLDNAQ